MDTTIDMFRLLLGKYEAAVTETESLRTKLDRCNSARESAECGLFAAREELSRANATIAGLRAELSEVEAATDVSAPKFDVMLVDAGGNKIPCVRTVRALTGMGLAEAKDLVESCPTRVVAKVSATKAEKIRKAFAEVGAITALSVPYPVAEATAVPEPAETTNQ